MAMVPQEIDFRVGSMDLASLLRMLKKDQKVAVKKLVDLMDSKDEKVALQAATAYLKLAVDVSKEVSADQLTRMIAQAKLQGSGNTLVSEKDSYPKLDFENIQDV